MRLLAVDIVREAIQSYSLFTAKILLYVTIFPLQLNWETQENSNSFKTDLENCEPVVSQRNNWLWALLKKTVTDKELKENNIFFLWYYGEDTTFQQFFKWGSAKPQAQHTTLLCTTEIPHVLTCTCVSTLKDYFALMLIPDADPWQSWSPAEMNTQTPVVSPLCFHTANELHHSLPAAGPRPASRSLSGCWNQLFLTSLNQTMGRIQTNKPEFVWTAPIRLGAKSPTVISLHLCNVCCFQSIPLIQFLLFLPASFCILCFLFNFVICNFSFQPCVSPAPLIIHTCSHHSPVPDFAITQPCLYTPFISLSHCPIVIVFPEFIALQLFPIVSLYCFWRWFSDLFTLFDVITCLVSQL